jgi:hypothetical protein
VFKKIKKPIKPRKPKKNNRKNRTVKKKPIKSIKILKKPTGSVRFGFGFLSLEPKKPNQTKPNPNRKKPEKPSQTGVNRFLF